MRIQLCYGVLAAASGLLAGCLDTQVNLNTRELAATVAEVEEQQVLENVSRYWADEYAIPAQVELSSGQISATNSVSPGLQLPFTGKDPLTRTFTVQGTVQWTANWGIAPITDPMDLARLRTFYRCAVTADTVAKMQAIQAEYASLMGPPSGDSGDEKKGSGSCTAKAGANCSVTGSPTASKTPHKLICAVSGVGDKDTIFVKANIFRKSLPSDETDPKDLGKYGGKEVFATSRKDVDNFLLVVLGGTVNTTGGGTKPPKNTLQFFLPPSVSIP